MAKRKPARAEPKAKPPYRGAKPEDVAARAIAHEETVPGSGDKVKLTLTVTLSRAQAERLTARAIREGKNLKALVAEILEAAEET